MNWIGDIGVTVCKAGTHGQGRAFDLSQLIARNGMAGVRAGAAFPGPC